jgi:hypothetical protein
MRVCTLVAEVGTMFKDKIIAKFIDEIPVVHIVNSVIILRM